MFPRIISIAQARRPAAGEPELLNRYLYAAWRGRIHTRERIFTVVTLTWTAAIPPSRGVERENSARKLRRHGVHHLDPPGRPRVHVRIQGNTLTRRSG